MDQREHIAVIEGGAPLGLDGLLCPWGHEHPDTPALIEDAGGRQKVDALGGGGRIDAVGPGQFVGAGDLFLLLIDAPEDVVLQHPGDLEIDQGLSPWGRSHVISSLFVGSLLV